MLHFFLMKASQRIVLFWSYDMNEFSEHLTVSRRQIGYSGAWFHPRLNFQIKFRAANNLGILHSLIVTTEPESASGQSDAANEG